MRMGEPTDNKKERQETTMKTTIRAKNGYTVKKIVNTETGEVKGIKYIYYLDTELDIDYLVKI